MNDGIPIVNQAAMVTWIGWNGYSSGSRLQRFGQQTLDTHQQRQQRRIHRLGQKQVGNPLDVADHPPALTDDIRECGKSVVQQHDLRHCARCRAASAHRDADVGVLEGQDVVDAVAGHRHGVAA